MHLSFQPPAGLFYCSSWGMGTSIIHREVLDFIAPGARNIEPARAAFLMSCS